VVAGLKGGKLLGNTTSKSLAFESGLVGNTINKTLAIQSRSPLPADEPKVSNGANKKEEQEEEGNELCNENVTIQVFCLVFMPLFTCRIHRSYSRSA